MDDFGEFDVEEVEEFDGYEAEAVGFGGFDAEEVEELGESDAEEVEELGEFDAEEVFGYVLDLVVHMANSGCAARCATGADPQIQNTMYLN